MQTFDDEHRMINYVYTELLVTMREGIFIDTFQVVSNSDVVAAVTEHVISFVSPVPLEPTDSFVIYFPEDTSPPDNSVACEGSGILAADQ